MKVTMSANQMRRGKIVWRWICSSGAAVLGKGKSEQRSGAGVRKLKVALQDAPPSVERPLLWRGYEEANHETF